MTRAERIRAVLREAGRPMTCGEVEKLVPGVTTHHSMGVMYRDGILARQGGYGSYAYWIVREPEVRKPLTPEERRARRAERERIRGRARRAEARAKNADAREALRQAREAAKAEAKAKREAEKAAQREARIAERDRVMKAKASAQKRAAAKKAKAAFLAAEAKRRAKINAAFNCAIEPAKPQLEDAPKRVVVAETVEEWMARTGRKPEVLPGVGEIAREAA